ncbi:MAG: DUF126 domain-containing protein [Candidatus Thorarchaeota archaeon]|nr:DUF126 domain-containing protein [Candidatus Thorarchaeota archaeon]
MIQGRRIFKGKVTGEVLYSPSDISFYGGCDPATGVIVEKGHPLEGKSISGKVLVFPAGKGSTVGSYVLYALSKGRRAPLAIINKTTDPVVAVGCIIGEIPAVDQVDVTQFQTGQRVEVDATSGVISILS